MIFKPCHPELISGSTAENVIKSFKRLIDTDAETSSA
jgi:hypothetical protein